MLAFTASGVGWADGLGAGVRACGPGRRVEFCGFTLLKAYCSCTAHRLSFCLLRARCVSILKNHNDEIWVVVELRTWWACHGCILCVQISFD